MATLLERVKSGEVKKVYNDTFGVSKKIILDETQDTYKIFVEFEGGETETFTNEGFVVYEAINMNYDIHPYNDPSDVQEIKLPSMSKMPDPNEMQFDIPHEHHRIGGLITPDEPITQSDLKIIIDQNNEIISLLKQHLKQLEK